MKVEWSAVALADLKRFASFLAEHHPALATSVAREIKSKVDRLAEFPHLGRPLAHRRDYRQALLRILNTTYVIRYRLRGEEVVILRVFHGKETRPRV